MALRVCRKDKAKRLHPYSVPVAKSMLASIMHGEVYFALSSSEKDCYCDLRNMKHINIITGESDDIIIEIPWRPQQLTALAAEGKYRRKLLGMIVDNICRSEYVKSLIQDRTYPFRLVAYHPNPYISSEHAMFKSFLGSLDAAALEKPSGFERLLQSMDKFLKVGESVEDILCVGFHGTSYHAMDNIMKNGMDPTMRKCGGDYFGYAASTSTAFSYNKNSTISRNGPVNVLVFLLITSFIGGNNIVFSSTAHELPIGKLTLAPGSDKFRGTLAAYLKSRISNIENSL